MSSRIRSELGSLGERVVRTPRQPLPCHVWVDGGPAVLLAWERRPDGWWGRCLVVEDGRGAEAWVRSDRIAKAI